MKIKTKEEQEQEVEAVYLHAIVEPRYWEDSTVNSNKSSNTTTSMPCVSNGLWKPQIRLADGKIVNWLHGVTADIHYKVCDQGEYCLADAEHKEIVNSEKDYVVNMMCPNSEGFGDYIIMNVDENGYIANWKIDFSDWDNVVQ